MTLKNSMDRSSEGSRLSAQASLALPTQLQENALRLAMSVTCGVTWSGYWGKRNLDGSWERMCQESLPLNMDDSSDEWWMTWCRWGFVSDGVCLELATLKLPTKETESLYLPTPTTSQDYKPIRQLTPSESMGSHGKSLVGAIGDIFGIKTGTGYRLNPQFTEMMMGFPKDWTKVD